MHVFIRLTCAATAMICGMPANPASAATTQSTILVFGNDPCPKGMGDEIVVCARQPESERYRIPKRFRDQPRDLTGPSQSWTSKVATLDDAARFTRPGGCSPVGTNGQTGCTQAMLHQWYLERQAAKEAGE